jgi:translation initiation factor 1
MPIRNDSDLVFSTDPELNKRCNRCKELIAACKCKKLSTSVDKSSFCAVIRLEKAHRGGKDVTVIDRLPLDEGFLKDLAQNLKKNCGTGGTYKINDNSATIEIQGDKRELIKKQLANFGIKCK